MRAGSIAAVTLALALGGCVTQDVQRREMAAAVPQHDAYCRGLGARPGTDAYINCRMQLLNNLRADQAEARQRQSEASDALIAFGAQMSAPRPAY